jgi:5'-3' exonuclease
MMKMMKKPNKAILDGDIIAYRTAFRQECEGPTIVGGMVHNYIKRWIPVSVTDYTIAFSCTRSDNFRRKVWPNYKLHRDSVHSPEYLSDIIEYIQANYKCKRINDIEADDLLGIYASSGKAIAVTIDKDLRGVRGWHFNPDKEKEEAYITPKEAERFFCQQWMTGDSTDGIPGLWRIGPKKAGKLLDEWAKKDWHGEIINMYTKDKHRPKDTCDLNDYEMAIAMARCVKILHSKDYNLKTKTIKLWEPIVGP